MPKNYVLRHRVNSLSSPTLEAGVKFFSLSGKPARLLINRVLQAQQGSYTLTGQDATFTIISSDETFDSTFDSTFA